MRALPVKTVAALAAGLRDKSRIKQKLRGDKLSLDIFLLAVLIDRITDIAIGLKIYDRNSPSILDQLTSEPKKEVAGFTTPEEFEARRKQLGGK